MWFDRRWFGIAAVSVSLTAGTFGCATGSAARNAADDTLTDDGAQRVIAAYENRKALRNADGDPLHQPRSLDDVLEILRRDQISLFPDGAKYAAQHEGPEALALEAQIELSWGEGQKILADLLERSSAQLRAHERTLELKERAGTLKERDRGRLDTLKKTVNDLAGISQALVRVGGRHLQAGIEAAKKVIDQAPSDYHGYRVAADYYRLNEDWARFTEMVTKIEALKPDSNGLNFLRGMEALERYGDRQKAEGFFRRALERDPKFSRAQVELLLSKSSIVEAHEALEKLREMSPHHQIVVWAAPAIDAEYESFRAHEERLERRVDDRMNTVPSR
jgi:tetratricopeptide (TPR) repeat protein